MVVADIDTLDVDRAVPQPQPKPQPKPKPQPQPLPYESTMDARRICEPKATLLELIVGNVARVEHTNALIHFLLDHDFAFVRVFGAQLISETSFYYDRDFRRKKERALVPVCLRLLHATEPTLQHEGLELAHALVQNAALRVRRFEVLIPITFALVLERRESLKWHAALATLHLIFTSDCREIAIRHLAQLVSIDVEDLRCLPAHVSSESLYRVLLGNDERRRLVALHFYENGWIKELPTMLHSSCLTEYDSSLRDLAYAVDAAVHHIFPPLQPPSEPADVDESCGQDAEEDAEQQGRRWESDQEVDIASEQRLRQRLEQHFDHYRRLSQTLAPSPPATVAANAKGIVRFKEGC
ncbi:hypothetical protein ATCC90586_006291 [Pythium insidiosum]|nr:hypothetical protein ATCC90586_006291 [Pythium insidiosum]